MTKEILPKELINFTAETYAHSIAVKSKIIYSMICLVILCAIMLLPFIYVDVHVSGSGLVRSVDQRIEVHAPVSGNIDIWSVSENQSIRKGQPILSVYPDLLVQKEKFVTKQMDYMQSQIKDVKSLIRWINQPDQSPKNLSSFYESEYQRFRLALDDAQLKISTESRIFDRQQKLYQEKVISKAEFERSEHLLKLTQAERQRAIQSQLGKWEGEKRQCEEQLVKLESDIQEIAKERERYIIKSPADGVMINLLKVQRGSYLGVNQLIGEISPTGELIAECFISPSDIGLLHKDQKVRIRIDAFNYNEWGFLEGEIFDISQDVHLSPDGSRSFFVVKCKLIKNWLALSNGYKGYLRKGMTLNGRFFVVQRSIYQLLFDKTDDWINPSNRKSNL